MLLCEKATRNDECGLAGTTDGRGFGLARAPGHLPEVGLEPGASLKIAISSASRAGVA